MTVVMYDAVPDGVDSIPAGAQAVAGYVDGFYVSFPLLVERFWPRAHILSIAVHPDADAECCDTETGDFHISEVRPWLDRQLARGAWRPCVYSSWDYWENQGLRGELEGYGDKIRRWEAAYPGSGPNVPSGYDAHQEADVGPYDVSYCLDSFFPSTPTPPPDPHHYDRFPEVPWHTPWGELSERLTVLEYDGARKHVAVYGRPHKWLPLKREQCSYLARRVQFEADHGPEPGWGLYWRRWRFEQLRQRAAGRRLA